MEINYFFGNVALYYNKCINLINVPEKVMLIKLRFIRIYVIYIYNRKGNLLALPQHLKLWVKPIVMSYYLGFILIFKIFLLQNSADGDKKEKELNENTSCPYETKKDDVNGNAGQTNGHASNGLSEEEKTFK